MVYLHHNFWLSNRVIMSLLTFIRTDLCFIDVNNFVLCGFGMWMLPYTTLGRKTLLHNRDPNPAEHTKVDTRHPPDVFGSSTFLCMLIIHAFSDLHPLNQPH